MSFLKSFTLLSAFLTFCFMVTLIQAVPISPSDDTIPTNETFTQTLVRENQDLITAFTIENRYFKALATGKATVAQFQRDVIQTHQFYLLWTRSAGLALTKAPVPYPANWDLGKLP